jgi:hypothetical protein
MRSPKPSTRRWPSGSRRPGREDSSWTPTGSSARSSGTGARDGPSCSPKPGYSLRRSSWKRPHEEMLRKRCPRCRQAFRWPAALPAKPPFWLGVVPCSQRSVWAGCGSIGWIIAWSGATHPWSRVRPLPPGERRTRSGGAPPCVFPTVLSPWTKRGPASTSQVSATPPGKGHPSSRPSPTVPRRRSPQPQCAQSGRNVDSKGDTSLP